MTHTPTPPVQAVIFDFDGTLADSFGVLIKGVEFALGRPPFSPDEIARLRHHSARDVIRSLGIKVWQLPALATKAAREIDKQRDTIELFPETAEMLANLRQQGLPLYIVSSHSTAGIRYLLQKHEIAHHFERIYGRVGLFGKAKALQRLQKKFGYSPAACVFIGDELRDVEAAKKAGFHSIAVAWGFNAPEALAAQQPDFLAQSPHDITRAVRSLQGYAPRNE